jgi:2,3,4,5-tetrahydropyridine-2-carboxylate N-succinyltransferase
MPVFAPCPAPSSGAQPIIAKGVVLMPSFVNVGAHVDEGTMIDTWATVGSCAQIGKNCHISGGAGIGGVLEPLQAGRSSSRTIASSARARKWPRAWSSAKARCFRWASSSARPRDHQPHQWRRVLRQGAALFGGGARKPAGASGGPALYCAVIVKQVDERTRAKTSINELLRD